QMHEYERYCGRIDDVVVLAVGVARRIRLLFGHWTGPRSQKGTTLTILIGEQNVCLLVQDRSPGLIASVGETRGGLAVLTGHSRISLNPGYGSSMNYGVSVNATRGTAPPYDRFSSHLSMRAEIGRGQRRTPTWARAWRESAATCGGAC